MEYFWGGNWFDTFSFMAMCIICFSFLFPFIFAFLVYKDAVKHNVEPVWVWPISIFFFSIFGLIAYIIAKSTQLQPHANNQATNSKPEPSDKDSIVKKDTSKGNGPITKY